MSDKQMIFDGTQYIDIDEIAVIYPTVTASETQRSVRLKSGHVHNSEGTIHNLAAIVDNAATGADMMDGLPRVTYPGRKIDD